MRKVCIISTNRADYGLIYHTLREVERSHELELFLLVSGGHFGVDHGETYREVLKDGFKNTILINPGEIEDSLNSIGKQYGQVYSGMHTKLYEIKPDLIVLLGDRSEMLAVATAGFLLNIPILHLCGGEITEGAIDDSIRHAITKLSNFHIVTNEENKIRLLKMGEFCENIFTVGAPGLENIACLEKLTRSEIEKKIGFKFKNRNLMVTFHPVTMYKEDHVEIINSLGKLKNVGQVITLPNNDLGNYKIRNDFMAYAQGNDNVFVSSHLGAQMYTNILREVDLVVGNSSSGIVEAPFLGTPVVDIGMRQKGRLRDSQFVFPCECDESSISLLIEKLLNNSTRKNRGSTLYGDGLFSKQAVEIIKKVDLGSRKFFRDNCL